MVAKLSTSVAAMLSRPRNAKTPTMTCTTNAQKTISATAWPPDGGSIPHGRTLTSTEPIATAKNPSGMGDPIGRRTMRVMNRGSGSNTSGRKTVKGSLSWPCPSGSGRPIRFPPFS